MADALRGSLAVVTGATGHIGRAIGLSLLAAEADVVLHGRDPTRVARLREATGAEAIAGDLTQPEAIAALRARVAQRGLLHVLTLWSGIYERSADPASLQRQFAANVLGPYALLQALLPFLIAAQGQVVFLNSTQGLAASGGVGQFAATQHAMRAIADSLREEVNAQGVRVLSIFLGRTASERQQAIFAIEGRAYRPDLLIQPADVAHAVIAMLTLPRTVEATQVMLRPMRKT
jgi:NADP-dependent 3-hydroxy acid dehydrogenase YdfG